MSLINKTIVNKSIIESENFDTYMGGMNRLAVQVVASDVTEALSIATTDVNTTTNAIESEDHGYINGTEGRLTTTDTLPTGLLGATDYYVFNKTDDTFQLSLTADGGSEQEITQIIATAEGSLKEQTLVTAIADEAGSLDQKYFILQDDVGSVAFWIDVDNSGTAAPSHGADRAVELITVTTGMTAIQVASAIYLEVVADSKFAAGVDNGDGSFVVSSSTYGVKAAATAGDSGFTVSQSVAGSSEVLQNKYFILEDADGTVAVWFNVDTNGVEPSHGADRALEVAVATGDSAITVADAAYDIIVADSKFEAGSKASSPTILVQNVDVEPISLQSAGDSGFAVTESQSYSDVVYIDDVGVGTHTFTPTALSGASATIQKSCDGINWIDVASATNITEDATFMVEDSDVAYTYLRVKFAITAGFMKLKAILTGWTNS